MLGSSSLVDLLRSYAVIKLSSFRPVSNLSPTFLEKLFRSPLRTPITGFLRQTFYRQFVGGETDQEIRGNLDILKSAGLNVILDYAAESNQGNKLTRNDIEHTLGQLRLAASILDGMEGMSGKSYLALKLSAFYPYDILLKMSHIISQKETIIECSEVILGDISEDYKAYTDLLLKFINTTGSLKFVVDAERLEIQPALDYITLKLMERLNQEDAIIMNTYQLYLKNSKERLISHLHYAERKGMKFAVKLVRGAYLKSDRGLQRGQEYGPIFDSIDETHHNYDDTVKELVRYGERTESFSKMMLATHNKISIDNLISLIKEYPHLREKMSCAQLYGMRDELTRYSLNCGLETLKYVPFGPVNLTFPYLMRRAQENSDLLRNSDELSSIRDELMKRLKRKIHKS